MSTGVILMTPFNGEDHAIDTRVGTTFQSPKVTQSDDPGEDLQKLGGDAGYVLPSASVGGENASAIQNGYSTGFAGLRSRVQAFTGAVAKPPAITNPVQGRVGTSNLGGKLYAGVMAQANDYQPDQLTSALGYVTGGGRP